MKKLRIYSKLIVVYFTFYLFFSTSVLAEDAKAEVTSKQGGPLQFIAQLFDVKNKKNPCQLKGGKPPYNRYKYSECLKKVRYLQNIDF